MLKLKLPRLLSLGASRRISHNAPTVPDQNTHTLESLPSLPVSFSYP